MVFFLNEVVFLYYLFFVCIYIYIYEKLYVFVMCNFVYIYYVFSLWYDWEVSVCIYNIIVLLIVGGLLIKYMLERD